MPAPKTLYTTIDVHTILGIPRGSSLQVKNLLAKVAPVHEQGYGSGVVRLYAAKDVEPIIEKYKADHLPRPAALQPVSTASGDAAQLKVIASRVDALSKQVAEDIAAEHTAMTKQNKVLLTEINKLNFMLAAVLKELGVKDAAGICAASAPAAAAAS